MLIPLPAAAVPDALRRLAPDKRSLPIFAAKSEIVPVQLRAVRAPALNIIKQEMLAAGGDAATPRGAVNCAIGRGDAVLIGTVRQYRRLAEKIALMPYFGLAEIAAELTEFFANLPADIGGGNQKPITRLADGRVLDYARTAIMGIINLTPDSFYASSRVAPDADLLIKRAGEILAAGADILDLGAESTRPGAEEIGADEEQRRLIGAIARLRQHFPNVIISADTCRAGTARAAIAAGADIINDISAAADPAMAELIAASRVPIIITHRRGTAKDMQSAENTAYRDVTAEVAEFLFRRAAELAARGIGRDKTIIDPGIGFAKTDAQNLTLLRDLAAFTHRGVPVLLAASRKTALGAALGGLPPEERLEATIAASCQAVSAGCQLVRVHDVAANCRAIRTMEAILRIRNDG